MTRRAKMMNSAKAARLQSHGWTIGSVSDFLDLTQVEAELIEMKLSLSNAVRKSRQRHGITQVDLASRLDSSQSRIAKLETGAAGVSLDLLVRAALATGNTRADVAAALANGP